MLDPSPRPAAPGRPDGEPTRPPRGTGPDGPLEGETPAHRGADRHLLQLPGRADEVDRPAPDELVQVDGGEGGLEEGELGHADDRLQTLERVAGLLVEHDAELVLAPGVAEA